jgi:hypothetical protein
LLDFVHCTFFEVWFFAATWGYHALHDFLCHVVPCFVYSSTTLTPWFL